MAMKQLSVFIENREGRIENVSQYLSENGINIISVSLADTSEYGMLRLIVSDPEKGKQILKDNGFAAMLSDVIAVEMPKYFTSLNQLMKTLSEININVEYMYSLSAGDISAIIIKTSDNAKASEGIEKAGLKQVKAEDVYGL
ncbi:MAG: amino acid-binding protein [Lachnospiraceae bacterium]|nr:amino acid-binding protein [Lachnospiraceae bacterium]